MDYANKSLKSQMKRSDKLGSNFTFIIGEEELQKGVVKVRDMKKSNEEDIKLEDVISLSQQFRSLK